MYDIIIIGGGCSGFGGAIYAGRFKLKTLVFTGDLVGGLITWTDDVSNYPGFKKVTGKELATSIEEHAREYEIEVMNESVTAVGKSGKEFLVTAAGKKYKAKTLLFATGTKVRKLGVLGENEFANKGVHYCALCDGYFYRNKVVAVIGGSDSAAKEALLLTQYAEKVYIIYRGEKIKPEPVNLVRVEKNKKIEVITKTNVLEIKGDKKVSTVVLDVPYKRNKEIALDGVFVAIGHLPLSDLAKSVGVKINERGEIMINRRAETNVPGVFAAGDVVDTSFKQAITGVAEAVTGVNSAYEYLESLREKD